MPSVSPHNLNSSSPSCAHPLRCFASGSSKKPQSSPAVRRRLLHPNRSASFAFSTIASNFMLPSNSRIALRTTGCFGARREEMSTVTVLQVGRRATRFASGVQCSVVPGGGSTGCSSGTSWRKTNGERTIRSRLPREVVISLSSSWPTQRKCFSARSRPISSHVWRIAVRYIVRQS